MENQQQINVNLKQRLYDHLTQIVRERDPYVASGGHFLVREYIRESLSQWGKVDNHEFEVNGKTYQNLILNLDSDQTSNLPPILIGAHYDAVPGTPGADDNATGVAVLLELAAVFTTSPLKYPVRLVAFDLEEYGLLGSTAYAQQLKQNKEKLRLMLSLEMLGYCDNAADSQSYPKILKPFYGDRGNFIALVGNLKAFPDLMRMSRQMKQTGTPCEILPDPSSGKLVPITGFSDHRPFWQQNYRAIMVTDTAMLRNPHYHQASDTIDTLDLDFLTNVCQSLVAALKKIN
ncbi:M28 family peptidase [Pleurocapsa sp. PCC 7319]|uniref:M28 family peptidase n=1 Tax=Pleurocapsa sp. PCC 7319 TaxID=118161 RepID=UPI000347080C|nr:M28 family peptidase [Pleurocapsa sp. PCC 7319]